MDKLHDIAAGRLDAATLAANFADANPPLTQAQALVEAARCYFCHDAPCMEACPTGIDVPGFIRKIGSGNLRGSAQTILEANILGGSCARVCPTEILCERACVRTAQEGAPIRIGLLQRHATDWLMASGIAPFTRAAATGKNVAVVGAGPTGLACAHHLARLGHEVTIFDAAAKPGGLNEYGIAAYKLVDDFAQREVGFLLSIGGISIEHNAALGRDITLPELLARFDAVFVGIGLAGTRALGLDTPRGVRDAVAFIAELRQADRATVAVGRTVVVIGGGNTAIDAAAQARLLGAEEVTILYRRGAEQMNATADEQDWARENGVRIRHRVAPVGFTADRGFVTEVACARTDDPEAEQFVVPADMVLIAIGQTLRTDGLAGILRITEGRIAIDATGCTSLPRVFAGGDCVAGMDLTVSAVEGGKVAARSIHRLLTGEG